MTALSKEQISRLFEQIKRWNFSPQLVADEEIEALRTMLEIPFSRIGSREYDLDILLRRLRQWDILDTTSDGPYWKREIDHVLEGSMLTSKSFFSWWHISAPGEITFDCDCIIDNTEIKNGTIYRVSP